MSEDKRQTFCFTDLSGGSASVGRARRLLEARGFVVSEPLNESGFKHTIQSLILYFYKALNYCNPDRKMHHSYQASLDRKHISNLVKSRENLGCTRARAYEEAFRIVRTLIENESFLGLSAPISSTSVLGQGWIINKAISIMNSEDAATTERDYETYDLLLDSHVDSDEFQGKRKEALLRTYGKVVTKDGEKERAD